jgi:hypothetical protein
MDIRAAMSCGFVNGIVTKYGAMTGAIANLTCGSLVD